MPENFVGRSLFPAWPLPRAAFTVTFVLGVCACGGTVRFTETTPIQVTATPVAPPPAPERVTVTADAIVIKDKIMFEVDKATIKPESFDLLDEIGGVLKDNAQIKKVSIEGHTDADGSDTYNMKLSTNRAKAVLDYLVSKGIEKARLTSKGFGESRPIADNETADGKEKNRRVEFLIVEQTPVETTVAAEEESP